MNGSSALERETWGLSKHHPQVATKPIVLDHLSSYHIDITLVVLLHIVGALLQILVATDKVLLVS